MQNMAFRARSELTPLVPPAARGFGGRRPPNGRRSVLPKTEDRGRCRAARQRRATGDVPHLSGQCQIQEPSWKCCSVYVDLQKAFGSFGFGLLDAKESCLVSDLVHGLAGLQLFKTTFWSLSQVGRTPLKHLEAESGSPVDSLVRPTNQVEKISVYPSDYGLQQLEREVGPAAYAMQHVAAPRSLAPVFT